MRRHQGARIGFSLRVGHLVEAIAIVALWLGISIRYSYVPGAVRPSPWMLAARDQAIPLLSAIVLVQAIVIARERARYGKHVSFGIGRWTMLFAGAMVGVRVLFYGIRQLEQHYINKQIDPLVRADRFLLDQLYGAWFGNSLSIAVAAGWVACYITAGPSPPLTDRREWTGRLVAGLIFAWGTVDSILLPFW